MQPQTLEDENVSLQAQVDRLRERDAATREILAVISQSRNDERPVLDTITRNAVKLCNATGGAGLWLLNDERNVTRLASVAQDRTGKAEFSVGLEYEREDISPMGQCYRDSRTISVSDIRDDPYYLDGDPNHTKMIDEAGIRSRLLVPLLDKGIAFGCISLLRQEVLPFSDEEITLIESFAAQAVIALEQCPSVSRSPDTTGKRDGDQKYPERYIAVPR